MGFYKSISSGNGKSQPRKKETNIYKNTSSYKPASSYRPKAKTKSSYYTSSYKQSRKYTTRKSTYRQTASYRSSSKSSFARRNNNDNFDIKIKDVIICAGALGILVLWFILSLFWALIILSVSNNGIEEGLSFILGAIISTSLFFALFRLARKIKLSFKKNSKTETFVNPNSSSSIMTSNEQFKHAKTGTKRMNALDGSPVEFVVNSDAPSGSMRDVYFSPKKDYVVAFYNNKQNAQQRARLESIVGKYRHDIFDQIGGDYWKQLFCWPEKLVEWEGKLGIVVPTYAQNYFFQKDPKRIGCEKEGKLFASAKLLRFVAEEERGNFLNYIKICLKLSQAVRRMHAAGLAHSDLSYKNLLIDPSEGKACVINIVDGLVVPGYPLDILGTPDFVAPEAVITQSLPREKRVLPSQATDRHALAVLIYMFLLHRHPLRGGRFFGPDVDNEETLLMGSQPLYIEHPTDRSNRNMKREYGDDLDKYRPWIDLDNFSAAKITGPFLASLFERAFIDGLKDPMRRPLADEWERAIIKTIDRLQPCSNPSCPGKWYVFDGSKHPRCPFCGTEYEGLLPKLEFYSCRPGSTSFSSEDHQLMVFNGQSLNRWHVTNKVFPNEMLSPTDKERQAYFQQYNGRWMLVNEKLPSLFEILPDGTKVLKKPGEFIELNDGTKMLLSTEDGGRLVLAQMAGR